MNQDNRNNQQNCFSCGKNNIEYFVKKMNRDLKLAICKYCYDQLPKMKDEYISKEQFSSYQNEQLRKAQLFINEICNLDNNSDYDSILTKDLNSTLKNCKEKLSEINNILMEVEKGNLESISRLLFLVQEFQDRQYNDFLISLNLGKSMNFLEKINVDKFRIEQDKYFEENFVNYFRKLFSSQVQNSITNQIVEKIKNCIDFPNFLKIIGNNFNSPEERGREVKQNYYGFLDDKKLKTGLGCWNQKNLLYYGIFYQDDFLWGIKVIIDSNTQFSLYKGFFSKIKEQDSEEFLINGMGEMFSMDEDQTLHEYIGKFYNEKRQGEGTYIWKPKDNKEKKYTGTWQNDVFHGQGSLHTSDQNIVIQGQFSYGVPIFESCQITGKNIPQQDFLNYVQQNQKQTEENKLPKQQFVMTNNFGTLQPQKQQPNFIPFNQNIPAPFQISQQQPKQLNQVNNQTPSPIPGSFQFQIQKQNQQTFNQVNFKKP